MKAAIYARYSSDKQSETSLDDQISTCQSRALREGWQVLATHSDTAISGSIKVAARPGGKALLADMMAGRFDVLLLESLDRLSRDQVEQESIVRRLEHRNIRIICVADGYDSQHQGRKVMRGVRGLINELYLDDLRHKTQRGLHGQVDRGYIAGGKSYGYDIERDDQGSKFVINELQAHWVRWIFEQVAKGRAYRHIVYDLNDKGVPSPRGSSWAVSAIYGSPVKGSGIINNQLYVGRYIWNRSQWIKDPDTGKRQRIERPRHEWREADLPELRIIDDVLWQRVRSRIDFGRNAEGRKAEQRPVSALLSGVLRCPHCAGPLTSFGSTRYGCSRSHDRGKTVCPGFTIGRIRTEKRMLAAVREELLSDDAAAAFEILVSERLKSARAAGQAQALKARHVEIQEEIGRLVDAIARMGMSAPIEQRIRQSERELATVSAEMARAEAADKPMMDVRKTFKGLLMDLGTALQSSPMEARAAVGEILGTVSIELKGREVWAQIATGPALQIAVGANGCNDGCGGRI
ncbi:recombinase family protein [Halopseudomonas bauzanensis]|uniref:recombinase family protein n=1 Tax=Halopseudomonas bauzanensis TaxID=653930 RepID=UPI003523C36E